MYSQIVRITCPFLRLLIVKCYKDLVNTYVGKNADHVKLTKLENFYC